LSRKQPRKQTTIAATGCCASFSYHLIRHLRKGIPDRIANLR
jgi:hypothetical protein